MTMRLLGLSGIHCNDAQIAHMSAGTVVNLHKINILKNSGWFVRCIINEENINYDF